MPAPMDAMTQSLSLALALIAGADAQLLAIVVLSLRVSTTAVVVGATWVGVTARAVRGAQPWRLAQVGFDAAREGDGAAQGASSEGAEQKEGFGFLLPAED